MQPQPDLNTPIKSRGCFCLMGLHQHCDERQKKKDISLCCIYGIYLSVRRWRIDAMPPELLPPTATCRDSLADTLARRV
eukprot:scaffold7693_cov228-Skeletonema_menzelii.AAC.3